MGAAGGGHIQLGTARYCHTTYRLKTYNITEVTCCIIVPHEMGDLTHPEPAAVMAMKDRLQSLLAMFLQHLLVRFVIIHYGKIEAAGD